MGERRAVGDAIVTCLECKVAWNLDMDPPLCENADHPFALNLISEGKRESTASRNPTQEGRDG